MLLNVRERWRPSRDFEVASRDLFQLGESLALCDHCGPSSLLLCFRVPTVVALPTCLALMLDHGSASDFERMSSGQRGQH